jgi:hypothetical protein
LENLEELDKFLDTYNLTKIEPRKYKQLKQIYDKNEIEALTVSYQRVAQDQMDV